MATISSLLTRAAIAAAVALPVSAFADEIACPKIHAGAALVTVSVFDGPPSERADLMPDTSRENRSGSRAEWSVAYIFAAGRQLYVECQYGGQIAPVIIEPGASTVKCEFTSQGVGRKSLVCKSRSG